MIEYVVGLLSDASDSYAIELQAEVQNQLGALGASAGLAVRFTADLSSVTTGVSCFFGDGDAPRDLDLNARIEQALALEHLVVPIVSSTDDYRTRVPEAAVALNGFIYSGAHRTEHLADLLLREIGVSQTGRRVFISHRRSDAMEVAEQLFDFLRRYGFDPFIDRFDISPGVDVQASISERIEDSGLVIFLESPSAFGSEWVFYEVNHALAHSLGVHIVRWPVVANDLPGTAHLKRQQLTSSDFEASNGRNLLTDRALADLLVDVEDAYSKAIVRRRTELVEAVVLTVRGAGLAPVLLPRWRVLVRRPGMRNMLLQVVSRLPRVDDLFELDTERSRNFRSAKSVIVHEVRALSKPRAALIRWAKRGRRIALTPSSELETLRFK